MTLPPLIFHQNPSEKIVNEHKLKTVKRTAKEEDFKNTTDVVCKRISPGLVNKGMWGKVASTAHARVQQSTAKLYGVAKRVQHHTTSRKTKEMLYRTTFVQ